MIIVLYAMTQAFFLLLAAPLVAGLVKIIKARLQNRRGPGVLQSYYDLGKYFAKDSVVSPTTSWIFRLAPFVYFAVALVAAGLLPVWSFSGDAFGDLFMLVYLLAVGRFFIALAALDAGSAFGGMGGSREMYISVLVEPVLLLALLSVAVHSGSTNLGAMSAAAAQSPFSLPYLFAAGAFYIVMIAENGRIPVDNPDTHLELTMIHEAMILEYSGRPLALITWAAILKQLVMIMLFVTLFIPWSPLGAMTPMGGLLWLAVKVLVTAASLAIVETSTNKMRLFRVPGFMALSCLLSLLALAAQ